MIRAVTATEIERVVELHRDAFGPEQMAYTIYGGHGVVRYLRSISAFPSAASEHSLWGAWNDGALLAYSHVRLMPQSVHLNNIAVSPVQQGAGVGRALWDHFVGLAKARGRTKLSLHVEADHARAVDWYRRRGLKPVSTVWRYVKPLTCKPHRAPHIEVHGWDACEAWQCAYGFSQFQLGIDGRRWTVGRLGTKFFRVTEAIPDLLESMLAAIDPTRRLLLCASHPVAGSAYQAAGQSLYMQGDRLDATASIT